ncbi:protein TASOR-like isoform X2 [Stigmatopora argus]
MDFGVARRFSCPTPRRRSSDDAQASDSLQDGECSKALLPTLGEALPTRLEFPGDGSGARSSSLGVHQRHMPKEPAKFHIPRKSKEKKALLKPISTESREHEDLMNILTAGYVDTSSAGWFTYSCPRLVHSELLEKEFVEKRREMKAEGRAEKELEETYCFLMTDEDKVPWVCEKGLIVGQNWHSALGDPNKGVYLSRYSDLIRVQPFYHGASGQIVIFKVMKGKVKSIYENLKNALDPTPRFDSHLSKNVSKVTSVNCFRAFEHTQHYFYEYTFDELRQRPRQVCPYAVVSFHYKGKDSLLPSMPLAPVRQNSKPAEASKEPGQFTVWSGELLHKDVSVFPFSLRSSSRPFLPHKLPERLEMGRLAKLDELVQLFSPKLFSYNVYGGGREVLTYGLHCSLLEVVNTSRLNGASHSNFSSLLHQLEEKRLVLVSMLSERGFVFLLSSAQMATPPDRGTDWKRCLQALFVFPESRQVDKCTSSYSSSACTVGGAMAGLKYFLPALHHALLKSHANPALELATGVELQAQEYLVGQKDGKVQKHKMAEYDVKADETAEPSVKRRRLDTEGFLRTYFHHPAHYQLSASHARKMVELHCEHRETKREPDGAAGNTRKIQQLMEMVSTCKRNAEDQVRREEAHKNPAGRKRGLEQKVAEQALKYLKESYHPPEGDRLPAAPPGSLAAAIQSLGLPATSVREDGSELADRLRKQLMGLKQAAQAAVPRRHSGDGPNDGPFDRLAAKMGLPANRDIDLRKQDELEEQTAGSVSSLEGFSPSGESYHLDPRGTLGKRAYGAGDDNDDVASGDIPWRLIPITGLRLERKSQKDREIPRDPRCYRLLPSTPEPGASPSPPPSPALCPSPSPPPSPAPWPPSPPKRHPSLEFRRVSRQDVPNVPPSPDGPPQPTGCPSRPSPPVSTLAAELAATVPLTKAPATVEAETPGDRNGDASVSAPAKATYFVDLTQSSEESDGCDVLSPPPFHGLLGRHLGCFSADLRLILQEENVLAGLPEASPRRLAEPSSPLRFSQYVSVHHPSPLVRGYVSSLRDALGGVLRNSDPLRDASGGASPDVAAPLRDPRSGANPLRAAAEPGSALAGTFVSSVRTGTDEGGAESGEAVALGGRVSEATPPTSQPDSPALPPPEAINSVLRQLRPEVLDNLCDIMKDVQKTSSVQFYAHAVTPDDRLLVDVQEYLKQQGHTPQDPVSFLNQEVSDRQLLVVIRNQDISEHLHQIPGLMSLKQHPSVSFVGINTLDELKSNTYTRLFNGGGCVLSEDHLLNPDMVTAAGLDAALGLLERRNSPESVWRWKVHSKPLKKLKSQARFRRDAAGLLNVILKRHQQKIVEVMPHHHCDGDAHPSPDLDCLIQHQANHVCFRHTVFLRVHGMEFMRYAKSGIISASLDEMMRNFDALLGRHDRNGEPTAVEEPPPKGGDKEPDAAVDRGDSETSVEDCDSLHSDKDIRRLHMAITHLRAEMQKKKAPDGDGQDEPAPPADEEPAKDAGSEKAESEPSVASTPDKSFSDTSPPPLVVDETARLPESDKEKSPKKTAKKRPHQSPPGSNSGQHPPWRRGDNHSYRYQNHTWRNPQRPERYYFSSDLQRKPAWAGQQSAGRGFADPWRAGYRGWRQGRGRGRRGGFQGM